MATSLLEREREVEQNEPPVLGTKARSIRSSAVILASLSICCITTRIRPIAVRTFNKYKCVASEITRGIIFLEFYLMQAYKFG